MIWELLAEGRHGVLKVILPFYVGPEDNYKSPQSGACV